MKIQQTTEEQNCWVQQLGKYWSQGRAISRVIYRL
jgi:hypothetical protein